jgi:hypothetical protein
MRLPAIVVSVSLALAMPARAHSLLSSVSTPRQSLLEGAKGQLDPVAHVQTDFFLLGLALVGAGLVLGGAGFAILYACREGTSCYGYDDVTGEPTGKSALRIVGWCLAAPGIIPLGIGLFLIYISSGGRGGGVHGARIAGSGSGFKEPPWSFGFAPLPGGGGVGSIGFRF